jgi:hypothetical protein
MHESDQTEVPLSFKKVIDKLFGQRAKGEKGQPPADAINEEKKAAKKDKKRRTNKKLPLHLPMLKPPSLVP